MAFCYNTIISYSAKKARHICVFRSSKEGIILTYTVPAKEIPVYGSYDVCVVGGGTAGTMAALAAAREGLKTLIVERFGALGGTGTLGLVLPVMPTCIPGNPQCSSFGEEVNAILRQRGYNHTKGENLAWHDSLYLRFVLDELCIRHGVEVLYQAAFTRCIRTGNRIEGIITAVKGGEQAIFAKRVIDCTGDADVAVDMGCGYDSGDPETGKNQPTSLRYIVDGINIPEFAAFIAENATDEECYQYYTHYEYPAFNVGSSGNGKRPLDKYIEAAIAAGELEEDDYVCWQVFDIPGRRDGLAFNCPEFRDERDGTDPRVISRSFTRGRMRILRHLAFYKKYFRGFENAYIAEISHMLGVRESRRIHADYTLTAEDVLAYRKFRDSICQSSYPIDIHGALNSEGDCFAHWRSLHDPHPYYDIPYRVMAPVGCENLLVAGRCAGFDYTAEASARMQHSCRAMGEAAGIACRISLDNACSVHDVDGAEVRKKMVAYGAVFAPAAAETPDKA